MAWPSNPIRIARLATFFAALAVAQEADVPLYSQTLHSLRMGKPYHWGFINILPDGQAVSTVAVIDPSHPDFRRFHIGELDIRS